MHEIKELAQRVQTLEHSNRRLRVILLSALSLAAMVALMGSASDQTPSVLEAQKCVLRDAGGHVRGSLFATESSWGLVLYNSDSSKGAAFIVSGQGSAAMLMNKKGHPGIAAMASDELHTIEVTDLNTNRTAVELVDNGQGSALAFRDGNGTDRVDIGFPSTGEGTILFNNANSITRTALSEDAGLATFDAKGSFVWAAGFDGFSKEEQKRIREAIQNSMPHR